jgi:hypothetical protein
MLESNVGVYVIYMQCEFIPCINLVFYILTHNNVDELAMDVW